MLFDFMLQLTEVSPVFGKKNVLKFDYLKKKRRIEFFYTYISI